MFREKTKVFPKEIESETDKESQSQTDVDSQLISQASNLERKSDLKELSKQDNPKDKKKDPYWKRIIDALTRPNPQEYDAKEMIAFREKIKEAQNTQKKIKMSKKIKRKRREVRDQRNSKKFRRYSKSTTNIFHRQGSTGIIRSNERIHASDSYTMEKTRKSISLKGRKYVDSSNSIINQFSNMSTEDSRYLHYLQLTNSGGPTHVSTSAKLNRKRKKKISQLYSGEGIYHHSLTHLWDNAGGSRYYNRLVEERRKLYPISPEIRLKIGKIKAKRLKKIQTDRNQCGGWILKQFQKTTLGIAFKSTPRYYKMTPIIPNLCRRCKYPLDYTLEARWTPIGITFAFLFPIIGILCCLANREFVCVVCEEIYVYGDYPSRSRPAEKALEESFTKVKSRKRSFKKVKNEFKGNQSQNQEKNEFPDINIPTTLM